MPNLTNNNEITINTAPLGQLVRAYNISNLRRSPNTANDYEGKIPESTPKDKELYKSPLGTPVVTNLVLRSVTYTNNSGQTITTREQTYETVLLTVNQPKKIVTTEIQGRDGTVKEYIGLDDYQVQINGIINGTNGSYPAQQVQILKALLDAPVAIPVVSSYLNDLGIYNLVVQDYTLAQEPGGYSSQGFSIACISDTPIELQIQ